MLRWCLAFFQVCGFFPVDIRKLLTAPSESAEESKQSSKCNCYLAVWSFVNVAVVSSLILYAGIDNDNVLYALTPIGKINDILIYFSLLTAHLACIIESFVKRNCFLVYWQSYEKLPRRNIREWQSCVLIKLVFFVALSTVTEVFVITSIQEDRQWTQFWVLEVFSLLMTRNRHLQHIFFIDVLYFNLVDLNSRLMHQTAWSRAIEDENCSRRFIYRNLSKCKEQFKHLMEMLICVNKLFCWSQVLNFGQHFIEITVELYWIYAYATGPKFLWATTITFVPSVLVLTMLLFSATRCIKEEKTALALHSIRTFEDDEKLRKLVMDFSLLIKQSPKHFTAKNFFVVDFTLLGKIISSMMTYLLIFISFQPKDDEMEETEST